MLDVIIDGKSLHDDFGIYVASITIGTPSPKVMKVEVPYSDGSLDLTDYFGAVRYGNRSIKIGVLVINEMAQVYSALINAFLGKRVEVICSNDADYVYTGRVNVSGMRTSKEGTTTIEIDCEPYKKNRETDERIL